MSEFTLFVQVQGEARIVEIPVQENINETELHRVLSSAGVLTAPDLLVFVDEAEEHLRREGHGPVAGVQHGARVHVTRCRQIRTSVHYLDKTIERHFAPGARVRKVKAWAVSEFRLDHKDAAEHVLQVCGSSVRPATDTPLHVLVHGDCTLCFDLVPEKRVEGEV